MIQANELRIGNWIYIDNGQIPKYAYAISGHDIEEIEDYGEDSFPIELTPDLLEKAGFTKEIIDENDIWLRLRCGQFLFETDESCDSKMVFMKVGARCVRIITKLHELQNLYFALIGKELTL